MPYDVRRFAMVLETGLMCVVLPASAAEAQPRPQPFEIAVGTQYGLQDPERPVTPGWILASGFDLGGHSFVLEDTWRREAYVLDHPWGLDEVFRESIKSRYWMVLGGVRSGERQGRVVPYYQILAGGFAFRFRSENEWPASIDTERENAECGILHDGVLVVSCPYQPVEQGCRRPDTG